MKKIIDFTIQKNHSLNEDTFVLELYSPELPDIKAGQFVNVKIENSPSTFLRRPISVHDVDPQKGLLYLLIKKNGKGTTQLSMLQEGDRLNIILPLGNNFSMPSNGRCLLVGGGVGIAPLFYLSKELKKRGMSVVVLIGARSKENIILQKEYEKYASVYYTTEDGSYGEKGFPTQHSVLSECFDHIYCCGPEPMMRSIAQYAYMNKIDCEVSLENTMACGIGACLCCVNETKEGHKCVCVDGPIFNINDLKWQS